MPGGTCKTRDPSNRRMLRIPVLPEALLRNYFSLIKLRAAHQTAPPALLPTCSPNTSPPSPWTRGSRPAPPPPTIRRSRAQPPPARAPALPPGAPAALLSAGSPLPRRRGGGGIAVARAGLGWARRPPHAVAGKRASGSAGGAGGAPAVEGQRIPAPREIILSVLKQANQIGVVSHPQKYRSKEFGPKFISKKFTALASKSHQRCLKKFKERPLPTADFSM